MPHEEDLGLQLDRLLGPRLGYVMPSWPRAVGELLMRQAAEAKTNLQALVALLSHSPDDPRWNELINLATIGHTLFYRHAEQLERLREELNNFRGVGPVWIWCAGCATGEEAYTMALCAESVDVEVRIVATDVDAHAVAFAERGFYPSHRACYLPFVPAGESWQAPDALRSMIRFEQGSLTDGPPSPGLFHYIFCRNVMVYFGARKSLHLARLAGYVLPRGNLIVAPTEALAQLPSDLVREQPLGWLRPRAAARPSSEIPRVIPLAPRAIPLSPRPVRQTLPLATPETRDPLDRAALLSAEGELGEAERALREALDDNPRDAVRWFLLGEVLAQRGENRQASVAFAQAERFPVPNDAGVEEDTLHLAAKRRQASLNLDR